MSDNDNKMTSQQLHLQYKQSSVFAARRRDHEFIQINVFHQIPIECKKNQMGLSVHALC